MIGFNLSTNSKFAIIWTILECYPVVDLILDSIRVTLAFYCKFFAFRIIIFYIACFKKFLSENELTKHTQKHH